MSGALDNFLISRMNDLLLSETNQIKGGAKRDFGYFSFLSVVGAYRHEISQLGGGRASIAAL